MESDATASGRTLLVSRVDVALPLGLAALVLPSLGVLAPAGTTPLLVVAALAALAAGRRAVLAELRRLQAAAALLAALAAWGALSALWSIVPGPSLSAALRFLLLAFGGLVLVAAAGTLDDAARQRTARFLLAGLVLGLAVLALELAADFPVRRLLGRPPEVIPVVWLDRGAQIFVLAAIAAAAALGRRGAGLIVPLAVALALWPLESAASVLSLGAALVAFLLGLAWPRLVGFAGALAFVALAIGMPVLQPSREAIGAFYQAVPSLRASAHHRLVIWNWTAERIGERPVLGWGFDASRAMPGRETRVPAYMPLDEYGLRMEGAVLPLHPHDAILQWWLELGLVGAVLGTALAVRIWLAAGRAGPFALALAAAAMPPLLLSFGVWQSWWVATLFLCAALLRTAPRRA
jgi:O-antigen ligase